MGILPTREAIKKAEELGYDLVEVAPTSQPPVCRIMDYGKYKYEQSKKQHATKHHQRATQLKEIKLRPRTDKHDLETKIRHIREFLEEGHKVKITLMFRGREMAYLDSGRAVLDRMGEALNSHGQMDQAPRLEGKNMYMIYTPKAGAAKPPTTAQKGTDAKTQDTPGSA
jgi:translation initiation factor IF-3